MVLKQLRNTNRFSTFFIKGKPVFSNGPMCPPKNLADFPILCNWVFDNFTLADKPFAKTLQSLKTCVLLYNNLSGKLVSWLGSPTTFDESFKVILLLYSITHFNLLSWI